ncbi:MAG: sulfurtransferase [Pseudomonadota bacterium]
MKHGLTRREFGLMSLAMSAAVPGLSLAESLGSAGYTYPHLLVEPGELIGAVSPVETLRPILDSEGIVLVDVRPREAFDAGHIRGARHLDPNAVVAEHSPVGGSLRSTPEIEALLSDLGVATDRRIIFYDDRGGFHAARMFWLLEYLGHQNVALLNGGFTAWQAANGPITQMSEGHDSATFQAAPSPRRFATADFVLDRRADPAHVLIDVRPTGIFEKGHIPWAVSIPWAQNLDGDKRFLPADDLRAHFEEQGVTPDRSVTMHCENGLASAHSYVALRLLGYPRVRVYHRSWAEWGSDPSLPKAVS